MSFLIYMAMPVLMISFLVTLVVTPVIKRISLRFGINDHPCSRKIHERPIPLLGGVALFLGFALTAGAHLKFDKPLLAVIVGASMAFILGLMDDIWGVRPFIKLLGQITVAIVTYNLGLSINFISNPFGEGVLYLGWLACPLTIIWIVAIMNTFNLIDGLDGLAAGVAAISALFLALVAISTGQYFAAVLSIAVLGSCLGFLRYNFAPAQIFMGDSGAMLLGYILAVISINGVLKSTIAFSLLIPVLVFGIPILDTSLAIFRRVKSKKALFKPDNEHIHHRLLKKGLSHKQATIAIYLISIVLGTLAFILSQTSGIKFAIILIGIIALLWFFFLIFRKKHATIFSFFRLL